MTHVTTNDILTGLELELVSGEEGLNRPIHVPEISRPGLEMAGYFDHYPANQIQLLGRNELSFFALLEPDEKEDRMKRLCSPETPAIVITHGEEIPPELVQASEDWAVPVLKTAMKTTRFSSLLADFLESRLAPTTAVHGVLVDIFGMGVLLTGKSGVGKSETALELIKRGHRLIADDSVEITQEGEHNLVGKAPPLIQNLLEIRGLGIIDIMTLFGASAVRRFKRISLVIELENWEDTKAYDRLGIDEEKIKILDTELTKLTVPVRPGRNVSVIIEVATMNHRLKRMGINAAQDFARRLDDVLTERESYHFE